MRKGRRPQNSDSPKIVNTKETNYKTSTHFIRAETDFVALIAEHFPEHNFDGICLSGLHTCGNLAASCLRIFRENTQIHCVCNVGCCYHLLGEEFQQNDCFANRKIFDADDDNATGFPMSQYLRTQVMSAA